MLKKRSRGDAEIPTASMADIAFLLLIFFLVTTTIDVDTGIGMTLPPPLDPTVEPPPIKERNLLAILVNSQGQILIEGKPAVLPQVREEVTKHITNNGADPRYAERATNAIVSLKTDRETPYSLYIDVVDEIWLAYQELRDAIARSEFNFPSYAEYKEAVEEAGAENVIKDRIPAKFSLAEPDAGQ